MKRATRLLGAALCLMAVGCEVNEAYVEADGLTYQAVAPEYKAYVEADPNLDDDQKARRLRTLDSWKLRIDRGAP